MSEVSSICSEKSSEEVYKRLEISDLEKWSDFASSVPMCHDTIYETPIYPINAKINSKIRICEADQYPYLEVDVIVFRAPDTFELSKTLMQKAGKSFRSFAEEKHSLSCGQIEIASTHNLVGAQHVAVVSGVDGPVGTFANSLDTLGILVTKTYKQLMIETKNDEDIGIVDTIAICGLYPTGECCYEGMHSAFRVLRKILENTMFSDLKSVVLCPISTEINEFVEVLAYYFPRNKNEELLAFYLPRMNYNEWGELIKETKNVKVVTRPGRLDDFNSMVYEVAKSDQDSENALKEFTSVAGCSSSLKEKKSSKRESTRCVRPYQRLLIDAKRHSYSGHLKQFLHVCGPNQFGEQTVVVIGPHLPFGDADLMNEAFLSFIDVMDHIVNGKYIAIFFCAQKKSGLTIESIRDMYQSLDEKYSRNLVNLFIVYCKVVDRIWTWAMTTMHGFSGIKDKMKFVPSLYNLKQLTDLDSLPVLPTVIYELETLARTKKATTP